MSSRTTRIRGTRRSSLGRRVQKKGDHTSRGSRTREQSTSSSLGPPTTSPPMENFGTGAIRRQVEFCYDLIPVTLQKLVMDRFRLGKEKYGPNMWKPGIPYDNLLNHLENHLLCLKAQLLEKDPARRETLLM